MEPVEAAQGSLEKRPFTVVAAVDTGINPYHVDFRTPELTQHPSTYITGFPRSAEALNLTLSAETYEEAIARDRAKWDSVDPNKLYWVPGTNIVGAFGRMAAAPNFLDQDGHGTAVASAAGGRVYGPRSQDILIAAVAGHPNNLEWAARQPWIDAITNSYVGCCPPVPQHSRMSRAAVESGKLVCFATGNFVAPVLTAGTQGPSWILSVGAASQKTRGEHVYTSAPADILGLSGVEIAQYQSIDGGEGGYNFGTSMAAPAACGQAARTISEVRRVLGDYTEGAADGLASGRKLKGGYLKDGCLDRVELEDSLQATAVPAETSAPDPDDPLANPAPPVGGFVRGGYGIVDHDSANTAIGVLLGRAPRPERALEDAWIMHTDSIRDALYGPPPEPIGCP
ncbi:MAG TPA: S8 family serine peptidase [Actinomycetota bacterium]|nr:S8 family serine peptidase [Actinomycetota bacterium]